MTFAFHLIYLIPFALLYLNTQEAIFPLMAYVAYVGLKVMKAPERILKVVLLAHVAAVVFASYQSSNQIMLVPVVILPYFLYNTTSEMDESLIKPFSGIMLLGSIAIIGMNIKNGADIFSQIPAVAVVVAGAIYTGLGSEEKKAIENTAELAQENKNLSRQVRQLQAKLSAQEADDRTSNYMSVILGLEFAGFSEEENIERVLQTIKKALNPIFCGYYSVDEALKSFVLTKSYGECRTFAKREEFGIGFIGETYNTKHFSYISSLQEQTQDEYQKERLNGVNCALTFPVVIENKVVGTFVIGVGVMSAKEEQTIANLCSIISDKVNIEFGKIKDHKQVTDKAITDKLTGLFNRLYFEEFFPKAFEKAQIEGSNLAYIIIDLDFFKQMNDTHGHAFGDKVLTIAAKTFKDSIRKADYAFRIGGDEFAVVLVGASPEAARHVATKIAKEYEKRVEAEHLYALKDGKEVKSSFSIGIAVYPNVDVSSAKELMGTADNAVYYVKEHGKNSIAVAREK